MFVPDGNRKHAAQPMDALHASVVVEVGDHLRVGIGSKLAALRDQLSAQLEEVVDLPVEDDRNGPTFVEDRLMSCREVDYAEASMPQHDVPLPVRVVTLVVRAAMPQRLVHLSQ